jgi:ribosomal protein S26
MNSRISISELSPTAVADFIADEKIRKFAPVQCTHCNCKGPFKRRIFRIEGKHRMDQNKTQDLFRRHIWNEYGLENVFFRTHRTVNYADVAVCAICGTTKVRYDIEFDDDFFKDLSKRLGIPKDSVKSDLHKIVEKFEKGDSRPGQNSI